MNAFVSILQQWMFFLSDNPWLRLIQILLLSAAVLVVFLVFYTTRDIVLRTRSFPYQVVSILVVACLPLVGFLLYLLFRPSRTLKERHVEKLLHEILGSMRDKKKHHGPKQEHLDADEISPPDDIVP